MYELPADLRRPLPEAFHDVGLAGLACEFEIREAVAEHLLDEMPRLQRWRMLVRIRLLKRRLRRLRRLV